MTVPLIFVFVSIKSEPVLIWAVEVLLRMSFCLILSILMKKLSDIIIIIITGFFINPYPAVHDNSTFANGVDPDQMASEEAI